MAQLMPLPLSLAPVKSRLVLPFWYRLTWVVPDKGPLNGWVCVCVCVCVRAHLSHRCGLLLHVTRILQSVCLCTCVGHTSEPCNSVWTNQYALCGVTGSNSKKLNICSPPATMATSHRLHLLHLQAGSN